MSVTTADYVVRFEGRQHPQEGTRNPCQYRPLEAPRELGRLCVPREVGVLEAGILASDIYPKNMQI